MPTKQSGLTNNINERQLIATLIDLALSHVTVLKRREIFANHVSPYRPPFFYLSRIHYHRAGWHYLHVIGRLASAIGPSHMQSQHFNPWIENRDSVFSNLTVDIRLVISCAIVSFAPQFSLVLIHIISNFLN